MNDSENIVLTLDNGKKYVVVESVHIDDNEYLYLGNIDDTKDLILCKRNNDKLTIVTDNTLKFDVLKKIGEKNNSSLNITE